MHSVGADKELVKRHGLLGFVEVGWDRIPGAGEYLPNWHIEAICEALEDLSYCRVTKQLINVPPGTGKSTLCDVLWPCWEWIERPQTHFAFASYDSDLVGRDARRSIELLRSDWFVERWGRRLPDSVLPVFDFTNSVGGSRFGTSIGGAVTGRHFDIRVWDDPTKPIHAQSQAHLDTAIQWHAGTWSSRLKDPVTARELGIMQRISDGDLSGHLEATGRYRVYSFPMRFDAAVSKGPDPRTTPGALLFPRRFPEHAVQRLEEDLGPLESAAQLQQSPYVSGGTIFRAEWFVKFWHPTIEGEFSYRVNDPKLAIKEIRGTCFKLPERGIDFQSWDLAFKATTGSSNIAGGALRIADGHYWLLDFYDLQAEFLDTLNLIRTMSERYPKSKTQILVEDKANGAACQNVMKHEYPSILLVNPGADSKEARAMASTPPLAKLKLVLPHPEIMQIQGERLIPRYLDTLVKFPRVKKNDVVDMTSQAIRHAWKNLDSYRDALEEWKNNHGNTGAKGRRMG